MFMASSSRASDFADYASISRSSLSSNEIADNIPGPGRIIGNFYSFAGRGLERQLGNIARRFGVRPQVTDRTTTPGSISGFWKFPPLPLTEAGPLTAGSTRTYHYADDLSLLSWSITSSNETADNLPGAGRILGNAYVFAGRGLEKQLGSVADCLGFGPKAVAVRIQKRREVTVTRPALPLLSRSSRNESKNIEKDCRRLLKCVRSNVASTKKQALDRITDLSIEDSYFRSLFKVVGAVDVIEPLQRDPTVWIYHGSSLQNSSRKALISLVDVEVNTLAQNTLAGTDSSVSAKSLRSILTYLHDSDRSFLVVRYT
ncbi:hypothetical protein M0805_009684 [Coniferiporia weirii]|nr:hypothetical protein M0805_009684 [Coniferiporia weirii]